MEPILQVNHLKKVFHQREKRDVAAVNDVSFCLYPGEILGIVLPEKIDYKVTETTDAVKGNTTNNAMKDATIESGYTIKVPMFISEGETIIVSTKDGKYVSRA